MIGRRQFLSMAAAGLLPACSPAPPWRIGYLGDLAHRTAGDGLEGRNGAILATEQLNAAGGIGGRTVELQVQDEGTDAPATQAAVRSLITARVDAIVGPFSSTSTVAVLPLVDAAKILTISPTAAAASLAGRDDFLVRISRTTRDNAADYARMLKSRSQRCVSVALDTDNAAFSQAWLEAFRAAFTEGGGSVATVVGYASRTTPTFSRIVGELLAPGPDGLLFIANSFDVAQLAQHARGRVSGMAITAAEWASYKVLAEFGSGVVEGLLIAQSYNPLDTSAGYLAFQQQFLQRFGREPGFNAVATVDAIRVLAQALAHAQKDESPRDAVLRHGPYEGLQQQIAFDRFGDTHRRIQFLQVRNGQFVPVQ